MADPAKPSIDELVAEYERCRPLYEEFGSECERVLNKLLTEAGLSALVHSVDSRAKGIENLREKIGRPDKEYGELTEVTDLAGLRIITYFAEDVDKVAAVVDAEFTVDWAKSADRREVDDPERFGYTSLHYVCSFSEDRAKLTDFKRFDGLLLEVQMRSLLQHGWAEIHHALGYKTEQAIPAILRRRFARLAGLLELADDEFGTIRSELIAYEMRVSQQVVTDPSKVQVDKASLTAFIGQDSQSQDLDAALAKIWHAEPINELDNTFVEGLIPWLQAAGLDTIAEVRAAVRERADLVVRQVERAHTEENIRRQAPVHRGVGVFRVCVVIVADYGGSDAIVAVYEDLDLRSGVREFADRVVATTQEVLAEDREA